MEISLAKPLNDKRKQAQVKREQRGPSDVPVHPRSDNPRGRNVGGPPIGGFGNKPQRGNSGSMNRPDDRFSKLDL